MANIKKDNAAKAPNNEGWAAASKRSKINKPALYEGDEDDGVIM